MNRPVHISVVIPVFNGERFLAEAVESVRARPETGVEIVVVDDGSTDGTAAVAAGLGDRIRLIRQPNRGAAAARNAGIRAARADVLAFLDADDRFTPDKLDLQLERLRRNPEVGIVLGQLRYHAVSDPVPEPKTSPLEPHSEHLFLAFGCALIRKSVFDAIGPISETMKFCEDWDWFMRAREAGVGIRIHRHVVLHGRLHEGNVTRQREAGSRFILEMFRRSLARRKAGAAGPASLPPLSSFLEPEDPGPGPLPDAPSRSG